MTCGRLLDGRSPDLAEQLDVPVDLLADYRALRRTRAEHGRLAQRIARFRTAAGNDLARLHWRLLQAALKHDSPLALLREACRWLRSEQIVRPGLTVLERTVSAARMDAERATHRELQPMLDGGLVPQLEALLIPDVELSKDGRAMTRLAWLAQEGKSGSRGVLDQIAKLTFLRGLGSDGWDLSGLNPNRRRYLAQLARRSTNQQHSPAARRDRLRHPGRRARRPWPTDPRRAETRATARPLGPDRIPSNPASQSQPPEPPLMWTDSLPDLWR